VPHQDADLVNWSDFARTRGELGAAFLRILGYFREDGAKSISAVEDAFRARNAAALVTPAHTLKGESAQFGAYRLSAMAEEVARRFPGAVANIRTTSKYNKNHFFRI